jgi:hypothetical protein
MDQHLVDHDLEEQGAHQAEQLQEKRGEEDFAEQVAVFVDGAQEPGDVEAPCQIGELGAAREQHQPAVPDRLKLGARQQLRSGLVSRLHQDPVIGEASDDQKAATTKGGDARQGRFCEAVPIRSPRPRLEPDHLGRTQHFGNANLRRSEHMPEAFALNRHAVKSSKNRESAEAGVNHL